MPCKHTNYIEIDERGFSGPISGAEENPAAHGCITVTDECVDCGARRRCNVNQQHLERGPWQAPDPRPYHNARTEALALCCRLEQCEVDIRLAPDGRRVLRNERLELTARLQQAEHKPPTCTVVEQIRERTHEARRVLNLWT